jgi:hypothetical protein
MSFDGDNAGIEARNLMLDTRVLSLERRASVRASTTIGDTFIGLIKVWIRGQDDG